MGEKIEFENGRISDFRWLVTLTLTLDRIILHTVMHHSSTSTYIPNFIKIEESFCGRTDGHLRPALLGRLAGVDLITSGECVTTTTTMLMLSFSVCKSLSSFATMLVFFICLFNVCHLVFVLVFGYTLYKPTVPPAEATAASQYKEQECRKCTLMGTNEKWRI